MIEQKATKQQQLQIVQLHPLISAILFSSDDSKPYMPPTLTKKICEEVGIQSNQQTFYALLSNIVDYSLDELITSLKQRKVISKQKKDTKQMVLKTCDLEKILEERQNHIARPRIYPLFGLSKKQEQVMVPQKDDDN